MLNGMREIHGMTHSYSDSAKYSSFSQCVTTINTYYTTASLRSLGLVRLETDLKHAVSQGVSVQGVNSTDRLVVISHGHEAETLALVSLQVPDHLNALNSPKRTEKLPKHVLLSFRCEVVHENAPTVHPVASRQDRVGQNITGQGWVSADQENIQNVSWFVVYRVTEYNPS